ncbi:MAG TPA: molybdopterin-dependent oxidoreductase [Candidatus Binataceae bacterium]|nr:molybdopterin-dependent oxidoreductase [Candidatus Binataceae bacterium]
MPRSINRRELILGACAASILTGCDNRASAFFLNAMERWNERFQAALFSSRRLAPELPPGSETPIADFPNYFISSDQPDAPPDWKLKIGGLVTHPQVLSLDELRKMPRTAMRIRHHCVEGWSAVAAWQGVRVSEIAKLVGLDPRVHYVEFRSFDAGYWSSWDLPSAFHPQTILAYEMDGEPLLPGHGAPLRLYSAVKLGYKMVKYLTEVNFLPNQTGGYWENQGYEWFAGV